MISRDKLKGCTYMVAEDGCHRFLGFSYDVLGDRDFAQRKNMKYTGDVYPRLGCHCGHFDIGTVTEQGLILEVYHTEENQVWCLVEPI